MAEALHFRYVAVGPDGRRVRGSLAASDEGRAFEALRARGFSPVSLRRAAASQVPKEAKAPPLRESADFLSSLADLLRAGADIRTALGILGGRSDRSLVKPLTRALNEAISSGEAIDRAFAQSFKGAQGFVASMVAAGEASGDLPGGLQRAADILYARLQLRDQLISVLSYPAFVLFSAVAAVFVILLFIVPSIAPLAQDAGAPPPPSLGALIAASDFLRAHMAGLGVLAAAQLVLVAIAARAGLLTAPLEAVFLDGPARRTVRGLVFGGFAISLGTMLAAGAPVTDALRLANRAVMTKAARRRIDPILQVVRQGQPLSVALESAKGFPVSVVRLAAVGEASNALGQMLLRGGKLEEAAAMRRIEAFGRVAGPALIVFLGLLLGLLMGGLLSGVSELGQTALS
jgi:type II secretory pathway component PulF